MIIRKTLAVAAFLLAAVASQAQEKVMNILKTDGTCEQTRVADLKQISFLTIEQGGQGLLVKTTGGETVAVQFETNPVVTVSSGKLVITPSSADAVEIEITDIAEIKFGDASSADAINDVKGFACVLQDGGALLRGIPDGTQPRIYSLDGKCLPTPNLTNGELRLNRSTLGAGIFIVKVGSFSTKIQL